MKTVVLADDHPIVRQGIRSLLETEPDFTVIGEAGDGLETIRLVEKLQPDLLVLDLVMNGLGGIEVTRQLSKRAPNTRVIILSMHNNEAYVVSALKSGAKAYVLKDSSPVELTQALRDVVDGHRFLSSALTQRAIEQYARAPPAPADRSDELTSRERQVLPLVAQGYTSGEISRQLAISARTVDVHRFNMMRKLGVRSRTELVRYAVQHGIVQP